MSDNPVVSNNSGSTPGDYTVEGDDIGGGIIAQAVALRFGAKDATERITTTNPLPVALMAGPSLQAAIQVSVTGSAGTLIIANASRRGLTIRSLTANSQSCFYGPASVTTTTGMEIKPGEIHSYDPGEAPVNLIQAISATGTQTIIVQESQ